MMRILLFVISVLLFSCKKDDNSKPPCDFFPIYDGQKIVYSFAVTQNIPPGQEVYTDRDAVVNDNRLTIGQNIFTLSDCATGKVLLRTEKSGDIIFVSNNESSDPHTIFSDGNYTVSQYKDVGKTVFSEIKENGSSNEYLRINFAPNRGITGVTEVNSNSGNNSRIYKMK